MFIFIFIDMHFSYGGVDLQNREKGLGVLDTGHHDQNI